MAELGTDDITGPHSPGRLLRRINRLLASRIESRFTDDALSYADWMALKMVDENLVGTPTELARLSGISTGATTRLIDGLEDGGWLERVAGDPSDRRTLGLRLTKRGRSKLREKVPAMAASWNEILEPFAASEVQQLVRLLDKLAASMERVSANTTIRGQ